MKSIYSFIALALMPAFCFAQQQDAKALDETAKTFMRQGDYTNAVVVLNRALEKEPKNIELLKDLAFTYYLDRNYEKAMAVAKPLTERSDGDVQSYQILGMVYKATEQRKECEKMYKQALKKFPESGVLYNEYGEVIGTENGPAAIKLWEKGIEADPGFATNYYNASKYYYTKNEKMWCALYGEIFANMESYSARTAEMKGILLAVYKKIFADEALLKNQKIKNEFESAVVNGLSAQANAVSNGVNTETLTVMRTEFILSWFNQKITRFPFRLFDYQQQLLKEGMFNAYNEWLFGAEEDLAKFQTWTKTHDEEYNRFIAFQKGRIFKVPGGQYYQAIAK